MQYYPGKETNEETAHLRAGHLYHTQVQHQMYLTGASYCDLEVYFLEKSGTFRTEKDPILPRSINAESYENFRSHITRVILENHLC